MKKRFIAVAGNIGVGKSSLTGLFSERFDWEPFFEAVTDNPYLPDFYEDMCRWSFHSQVFFLSRRLRHHHQLIQRPNSVVQDRTVYEDAEIFACNLYRRGLMEERDYQSYQELYDVMVHLLPPPDLVVYLRASVPVLMDRIAHRGRSFERSITQEYLDQLNDLYEEWVDRFDLCPVLTVPSDNLDFVANSHHLDLIAEKVTEKLQGQEEVIFS
jgi:deoxyadenosine/deoxycytidine kinase